MRHTQVTEIRRRLGWLRGVGIFTIVACLNPMPEEFPSEQEGAAPVAASGGANGFSGDPVVPPQSGAAGSAATPDQPPADNAAPSTGQGNAGAESGVADAGVDPDAADAGAE